MSDLEGFVGKSYPDKVAVQDAFLPLLKRRLSGMPLSADLIVLYPDRSPPAIPTPDFGKAGVFSISRLPSGESSDGDS